MMARLLAGERLYVTEHGSWVRTSGKYGGIVEISFDWYEEGDCCDAVPEWDGGNQCIIARCDCCGDARTYWVHEQFGEEGG